MQTIDDKILKADREFNFGAIPIGESFFRERRKDRYMVFSSLRSYNKTYGTEIRIRTQNEGEGVRVYRIS